MRPFLISCYLERALRRKDPHPKPLENAESHSGISPLGTTYSMSGKPESIHGRCLTLVFIHGVGLNKAVWQAQHDAFSADYQVISYDMLGHGGSPQPPLHASLENYAAQLAELLTHLNITRAHIIGHSMGALVSVAFALDYPQLSCSLVAMNIVYQRNLVQREAVLDRAAAVLQSGQVSGIELALKRWFENESGTETREKMDRIRGWMDQANPTGYGRSYQLFASSDRAFTGRLRQLAVPVLYLTGSKDANSTPAMSQQMAMDTPSGQATVLEDQAHMMAYIHPDKVNPVIKQFLNEASV